MSEPQVDADFAFVSADELRDRKPDERGFFQSAARRGRRYIQRGAEAVLGMPGDIFQLARALPGGMSEEEMAEQDFPKSLISAALGQLPGSEELRALSAEIRPELEPESEFESVEDEFVGDAATLMLPVKGKIPFVRALGLSAFGNLTKQGIKAIGGTEATQEAGKLGAILFGGLFGKGRGVGKYIDKLYEKSRGAVPKGDLMKYPLDKLERVEKMLAKGSMNEAKSGAMQHVQNIKGKIKNGMLPVEEWVQFDKDINYSLRQAGKDASKAGNLKQVHSAHASPGNAYAKENPSWGEYYKDAKMAKEGIAQSEKIQNTIRKHMNLKDLTYAGAALGMEEMLIPGNIPLKVGSLGAAGAAWYSKEIAKRLATNPALRRYYQNVLTASLSENSAMLARNMAGLERVAKKEFENNPIPVEMLQLIEDDKEDQ